MISTHARRPARLATGLALAVVVGGAAAGSAAAATPSDIRLDSVVSRSQSVTTVTTINGRTITQGLGMFRGTITPVGGASVTVEGFCDEPLVSINLRQTYRMQLADGSDDATLASREYQAVEYLIRTADERIAAAADPQLESGATQVAVWQLGGNVILNNPTTSPAMNARAAALRAEALATTEQPSSVVPGGTACAGSGEVDVRISGAPGAIATVQVTTGAATASATRVVLDTQGQGTVRITSTSAGASNVRVTLETGGLVRATRFSGQRSPQQTVMIKPDSTVFNVPVQFEECTSTVPGTPSEPGSSTPTGSTPDSGGGAVPSIPTQAPAGPGTDETTGTSPVLYVPRLGLIKRGPKRARVGARVNYKITVVNRGKVALSDVVVTDAVPAGMYVPSKTASSRRLRNGAVTFRIASLAPGQRRVLTVQMRALRTRAGRICNTARASASAGANATRNSVSTRSTACTRFIGRPVQRTPIVTG
ncbi:MAG: hypothetical protein R2878_05195 [Thermoleophilia bacterium]